MIDFGGGKKASPGRAGELGFADIVGQTELKEALLTVAANDDLDGLLIQGEKGTAKSTAVRALAALLPDQTVVADCPYGCPPDEPDRQCEDCRDRTDPPTEQRPVPLVTLPLGATRERVVGTLSVADALAGDYEFDPGLLARANRGILYVDEVNLLDDHLVDVLLDAAASGTNRVERDGVSVAHPADFTLVGTMNPEEGELRPQLRDRFALQATVTGADDLDDRVAIIEQALTDGDDGDRQADVSDDERRTQLREARAGLSAVTLPPEFTTEIAKLCRDAGVDGHRADIATARAARTLAALDGRAKVLESDVRRAAAMALPHRLRSRPFEDAPDASELLDDHFDDESADESERDETDADGDGDPSEAEGKGGDDADGETADDESGGDTADEESAGDTSDGDDEGQTQQPADDDGEDDAPSPPPGTEAGDAEEDSSGNERGENESGGESDEQTEGTPLVPGQSSTPVGKSDAPDLSPPEAVAEGRAGGGRGSVSPAVDGEGARVRTQRADSDRQIDAAASVRAATARGNAGVESRDLRQSVRERDSAVLVVFAVDASASMRPAMRAAKGTVLELLKDAYQERDEVAFVTFAGEGADVLLPPTDSVTLAARHLKDLPTGDRTPLPAGLRAADDVIRRADPAASVVVLVTDGRANVADGSPTEATRDAAREIASRGSSVVVVDAGDDGDTDLTGLIADETDGRCVPLDALSAEQIDAAAGAASTNEI
ncbi:ATP-binding protein [Halomicrobium sp. HM KBTZ05]|uniref:ATP-binding protein n=1 Tax=Halomicrobium sp. HM KBTZ05 TaxID=3242663 RepID=UPI0035564665